MEPVKSSALLHALIMEPVNAEEAIKQQCEALRREQYNKLLPFIPKLTGAMLFLAPSQAWNYDIYSWVWSYGEKKTAYSGSVHLNFYIKGITSWSQLIPIFEILELADFNQEKWTSADNAESYTRVYQYKLAEDPITCSIRIHASLPGDTDECRRVIVGYTEPSQEVHSADPIYKLECQEATFTAEPTDAYKDLI